MHYLCAPIITAGMMVLAGQLPHVFLVARSECTQGFHATMLARSADSTHAAAVIYELQYGPCLRLII